MKTRRTFPIWYFINWRPCTAMFWHISFFVKRYKQFLWIFNEKFLFNRKSFLSVFLIRQKKYFEKNKNFSLLNFYVNCLIKKFLNKNEFNLFEYLWNLIKLFRDRNIFISIKLKLKRFCFSTRWVTVSDQRTTMVRSTSSCEKNWELSQDHF